MDVWVEARRRERQVNPLLHSTPRRDLDLFGEQSCLLHAAKKNLETETLR